MKQYHIPEIEKFGWNNNLCSHSVSKTFIFSSKPLMLDFIVDLLKIYHEPQNPHIEAIEKPKTLSVEVVIELSSCYNHYCVSSILKNIEETFNKSYG